MFTVNDSLWSSPVDNKQTRTPGKRTTLRQFLGMMEKDSVFITLTEEEYTSSIRGTMNPATTRGTYTAEEVNNLQFYTTAYMELPNGTRPTWIDNTLISKTETNPDRWSGNAYWPHGGYTLHFYAHTWNVWPESGTPVAPVYTTTGSNNNRTHSGSFNYTLPAAQTAAEGVKVNDAARQPDLLFAITPEQTQKVNPTVQLTFYHALAAVRFQWGNLPEDVVIKDATLSLGGVVTSGSCSFNHPLDEGDDFQWTLNEEKAIYTIEGFQGEKETESAITDNNMPAGIANETYMMLPQPMTDEVQMKLSIKVGEKEYHYEKDLQEFESLPDWKANKRYTYTFSISEYVEVDIDEEVTSTVKSNVRLQNTGLTTAYLRAAVVGYWENKDGDIIGSWNIDDTTIGQLTKATNWSTHWEKGTDGFYYHKTAVLPGEYTNVALFDKYELNSSGAPEEGAKLIINIVAQAIDTDLLATSGWPLPSTTTTNE